LTIDEIARAFLVPEATVAQRITRAKRTLADAAIAFELPPPAELGGRLESVLEVIYLVFNEGYLATAGDDWMRPALCGDALRLGRTLTELMPAEAEVHGLLSLMEIQASRRGLEALARAEALAAHGPGPYSLQAAIAACHARAATAADTDWARIVSLYAELGRVAPSPIVELNRAVAASMAFGPAAGLAIVEPLCGEPSIRNYPFLASVHADLLARLGRFAEARAEAERAASLTKNARDRSLFIARAADYAKRAEP